MFAIARLDTPSDGIFGVAMTLLILDVPLLAGTALNRRHASADYRRRRGCLGKP
jgi:hypothetical protein